MIMGQLSLRGKSRTNRSKEVFYKNIQTNVVFQNQHRLALVLGITKTALLML